MIRTRGLTTPYRMSSTEVGVFVDSIRQGVYVQGAFVEIGVLRALSTHCLLETLASFGVRGRTIYGIDVDRMAKEHHEAAFAEKDPTHAHERKFLLGRSNDCLREVPPPIAWAFVDGCHCRDCVSDDIRLVSERLQKGGVIVLHDSSLLARHVYSPCVHSGRKHAGEVHGAIKNSILSTKLYDMIAACEWKSGCGIRAYRRIA